MEKCAGINLAVTDAMKLDDLKKFDVEKFDWVEFSKKILTPKPIFGRKQKKKPGEVSYAGFSNRMFAITVDMILFYLALGAFFTWLSGAIFPNINQQEAIEQFSGYLGGVATHQLSPQQAWEGLLSLGIINKVAFDYIVQTVAMGILVVTAWTKYATTPGMALFCMYVADAETGGRPTLKQSILRFLGVILAMAPLTLGMVWILFDKRNQAWQDKIAGTVVLQKESRWPWQKKQAEEIPPPPAD